MSNLHPQWTYLSKNMIDPQLHHYSIKNKFSIMKFVKKIHIKIFILVIRPIKELNIPLLSPQTL